ncbi:MAG: carboxypeptidase-like regulatory domain-containing protein [Deinococcales bacterium]
MPQIYALMPKIYALMMVLCLGLTSVFAQQISGFVYDSNSQPLAGVIVSALNLTSVEDYQLLSQSEASAEDGSYQLSIAADRVDYLIFTPNERELWWPAAVGDLMLKNGDLVISKKLLRQGEVLSPYQEAHISSVLALVRQLDDLRGLVRPAEDLQLLDLRGGASVELLCRDGLLRYESTAPLAAVSSAYDKVVARRQARSQGLLALEEALKEYGSSNELAAAEDENGRVISESDFIELSSRQEGDSLHLLLGTFISGDFPSILRQFCEPQS